MGVLIGFNAWDTNFENANAYKQMKNKSAKFETIIQ